MPFVARWGTEIGTIDANLSSTASEPIRVLDEVNNTNLHSSFTGLSGSKYADRNQRFSVPTVSFSALGQRYDLRDDEDIFNSGLHSPPKVNLADLIGSSDGEGSSDSENSIRAVFAKSKGKTSDGESASLSACETKSEKIVRPTLANKVFDSAETKIDEENLVLPTPDFDVDAVKGDLETTPGDEISEKMGELRLDTPKSFGRGNAGDKNVPAQQGRTFFPRREA